MASKKYSLIRTMYLTGRIKSKEVWDYADDGTITEDEAVRICGPRPA